MKPNKFVSINPEVCGGLPCVAGHRIPIYLVIAGIASSYDLSPGDAIRIAYPELTDIEIRGVLDWITEYFIRLEEESE